MPHCGHKLLFARGISLPTGQQSDESDARRRALSWRVFEEAEISQLEGPAVLTPEDKMMAGKDIKPCPDAL